MIIIKLNIVFLKNNVYFYLSNVCFLWCLKCTSSTNKIKMTKKVIFDLFFFKRKRNQKKRNFQSFRNIFFGYRAVTFTYSLERAKPLSQHMLLPCCIPGSFATNFHYIIWETSAISTPSRWFYSQENVEFSVLFLHGWLTFAYYLSCIWK